MTEPELLEPAEARAANPHLRGLGSSSCPYGECDGNGLVLEESGDARPCRCRAERIARGARAEPAHAVSAWTTMFTPNSSTNRIILFV